MPYVPDQPWDKTLSYTYGQTCIFNGLRYIWWSFTSPSTIGKEPPTDEVMFTAAGPFGSTPESRLERGWVLSDTGTQSGDTYGNVESIVMAVRNLPQAPSKLHYDKPQGIKWYPRQMRFVWTVELPDGYGGTYFETRTGLYENKTELSWSYYGQEAGYSTDYGLVNVTPYGTVPANYGFQYPGLYDHFYPDNLDRLYLNVVGTPDPPEPGKLKFRVAAGWPLLDEQIGHGTANVNETSIWFNRTVSYTVVHVFYLVPPFPFNPSTIINTTSGSLNTGPQRDAESFAYGAFGPNHEVSVPEHTVNADVFVQFNSFTPPLED